MPCSLDCVFWFGEVRCLSLQDLPHFALPKSEAVDKLATEVARLKKKGHADPYVCVDLKDFLPQWAALRKEEADDAPGPDEPDMAKLAHAICKATAGKDAVSKESNNKYLDITRFVLCSCLCLGALGGSAFLQVVGCFRPLC